MNATSHCVQHDELHNQKLVDVSFLNTDRFGWVEPVLFAAFYSCIHSRSSYGVIRVWAMLSFGFEPWRYLGSSYAEQFRVWSAQCFEFVWFGMCRLSCSTFAVTQAWDMVLFGLRVCSAISGSICAVFPVRSARAVMFIGFDMYSYSSSSYRVIGVWATQIRVWSVQLVGLVGFELCHAIYVRALQWFRDWSLQCSCVQCLQCYFGLVFAVLIGLELSNFGFELWSIDDVDWGDLTDTDSSVVLSTSRFCRNGVYQSAPATYRTGNDNFIWWLQ